MTWASKLSDGGHDAPPDAAATAASVGKKHLATVTWFGLLAGWLELGLLLSRKAMDLHVSRSMLRMNRHFIWMVPASNFLVFAAVGLVILPLAWVSPRLTRWLSLRLSMTLLFLIIVWNFAQIHRLASVILAWGLATEAVCRLRGRGATFRRVVRITTPVMAVGLVVLIGVGYAWVESAEHRTLSQRPSPKPDAPNVLLIVLDNVRAASLSLYGHYRLNTPNLERWAKRGVVYTEAHATAPWTLPTHASLLTGRWPHELSVGWKRRLDGTFPTLAEILGQEGYATAGFVGNTFFCNSVFGLSRGFAHYEDAYENEKVSLFETIRSSRLGRRLLKVVDSPTWCNDWTTSIRKTAAMINHDVLDWLGTHSSGRPYFVFINYYDAHAPFGPPEGPDPRFGLAALPPDQKVIVERTFLDYVAGKPTAPGETPKRMLSQALDMYRDLYESSIAYLDRHVGLLLDEMERRGLLENTLVIVTSDHGEHFGGHGLLGHCLSLYRGEVHVPLLIIPPSRSSTELVATKVNEPVSLREIPATVAEWVGLGPRSPFPGQSLTRFLGTSPEHAVGTSPVLCEVEHMEHLDPRDHVPASMGAVVALVSRDGVYIRRESGREELYDPSSDPREENDLAPSLESRSLIYRFRDELNRSGAGAGLTVAE